MRSAYKIVNTNTNIFFLALFSAILLLYACGGSGDSGGTASDTGSISFSLKFDDTSSAATFRAAASPSGDVCKDYQIIDIAADVYDSSNSAVASDSWPCSAHQGTIDDVPAESDLSLIVEGITVLGKVEWRGEIADITILPGEVTDVGTVTMTYIGDDTTPPEVESTSPESGEMAVSIGDIITVTFSEEIVSASINEMTFILTTDTTQISGTVTYDPSMRQASFTPVISLDYLTTYTATITTDVEDLAGNPMTEEYTWSFTTTISKGGLVAGYPFNGDAEDKSGNGYDGIIHGDTSLCEDRFGSSDSAYCFDGDGDYIEIPVMNFLQDFTVTSWFSANSTSDWARIFDFGIGNYGDCFLTVKHQRKDEQLGVTIHDSSGGIMYPHEFGAGINVNNGIWYFVAFTYDKGGDGMALYVDGQIKNSDPYNNESFDDWGDSQKWYFGKSNWEDDPYFHGVMDDIRIYNRALSEAEIKALYNLGN